MTKKFHLYGTSSNLVDVLCRSDERAAVALFQNRLVQLVTVLNSGETGMWFHEYYENHDDYVVKPAEVVIEEEIGNVSVTADGFIDVEGGGTF